MNRNANFPNLYDDILAADWSFFQTSTDPDELFNINVPKKQKSLGIYPILWRVHI